MSSFLSNKLLKYRSGDSGGDSASKPAIDGVLDHDQPCIGCGYNLRGLMIGRNCPECGMEILRKAPPDPLTSGEWSDREHTLLALTLLGSCLVYAALARLGVFALLLFFIAPYSGRSYVIGGAFAAIAWVWGTWLITSRSMRHAVPHLKWLAISCRVLSLCLIPGFAAWLAANWLAGVNADDWMTASMIFRAAAGIGIVSLMVFLLRLASAAELEDVERRFVVSLWNLPIPTLLLASVPTRMPWVFMVLVGMVVLWWCWFVFMLGLAVLGMSNYVRWSMRLAGERALRLSRVEETRRELDAEVASQVRPLPRLPGDIPLDR